MMTTLKNMNTHVLPVADFGTYSGGLSYAIDDVFVWDCINVDALNPDSEEYEEIMQLIAEKYNGIDDFLKQVLSYAPETIQAAFDDYEIPIHIIPDSCKWDRPQYYNYRDDCIEFDMTIDTDWIESQFGKLSNDPEFKQFIKDEYSSRDGFISFMPNTIYEYEEILESKGDDYWKIISAIVTYMVYCDPSIRDYALLELEDALIANHDYVRCSELEIY